MHIFCPKFLLYSSFSVFAMLHIHVANSYSYVSHLFTCMELLCLCLFQCVAKWIGR